RRWPGWRTHARACAGDHEGFAHRHLWRDRAGAGPAVQDRAAGHARAGVARDGGAGLVRCACGFSPDADVPDPLSLACGRHGEVQIQAAGRCDRRCGADGRCRLGGVGTVAAAVGVAGPALAVGAGRLGPGHGLDVAPAVAPPARLHRRRPGRDAAAVRGGFLYRPAAGPGAPERMKLWLLRHARVSLPPGLCYGASDVPADEVHTRMAARHWAQTLPAGLRLRVSALGRAGQLARALRALRPDLPEALVDARLNEMDFGRWEQQHWDAIPRAAFDDWMADFAHHRVGGGESTQTVIDRVAAALADERARASEGD